MKHNPDNTNCDLSQYGDTDGVRCTCDVDDPPPEPSTRPGPVPAAPVLRTQRAVGAPVMLSGDLARAYLEFEESSRAARSAKEIFEVADKRWRAALEVLTALTTAR